MKKIELTRGRFALVDDADYDWLNQYKWFAYKHRRGNFYAARMSPAKNGKRFFIRMSREILGLEHDDKRQADHIHHNTLDNRRVNLRICTHSQNMRNRNSFLNTSSRYKGVSWYERYKKWRVGIWVNGKKKHLGYFDVEVFAALAYNSAAKKYFGEFACLNLI